MTTSPAVAGDGDRYRAKFWESRPKYKKSGPKYNSIPISGPKYSSDVDQSSDHIFRLADQGFILVPHSNYGSICYRLATIHFRDKQTDRQTDSTIAIAIRYLQ